MTRRTASEDFPRSQGLPFLAHLLRRLADRFVAEAQEYYAEQGIVAPARTASTLILLQEQGLQSVSQIASKLRQSHPLVITWIRQLSRLELVEQKVDPLDRRRTLISLTPKGQLEAERMAAALSRLGAAYEKLLEEVGMDVQQPLWRLEEISRDGRLLDLLRRSDR